MHGLSTFGTWAYLLCSIFDLSSLTRHWSWVPCIVRQILNHWTTREVPLFYLNGLCLSVNCIYSCLGFPGGSDGKEFTCNAEGLGSIHESEDPLEKGRATHSSILAFGKEPHGQRSLVGYSPKGHKESDTTEWFTLSLHFLVSQDHYCLLLLTVIFPFLVPLSTPDSLWGSSQIQKSQNPQVHNHFTLLE